NPSARIDAEMLLASRQQQQEERANVAATAAGRGLQSLAGDAALSALSGAGSNGNSNGSPTGAELNTLPLNGVGADAPTESVSITGGQGRRQDFGGSSEQDIEDRIQEFRERMQEEGGGGLGGGPFGGGGGGFGGGGGPIAIGRIGGRGFNINEPHGVF